MSKNVVKEERGVVDEIETLEDQDRKIAYQYMKIGQMLNRISSKLHAFRAKIVIFSKIEAPTKTEMGAMKSIQVITIESIRSNIKHLMDLWGHKEEHLIKALKLINDVAAAKSIEERNHELAALEGHIAETFAFAKEKSQKYAKLGRQIQQIEREMGNERRFWTKLVPRL